MGQRNFSTRSWVWVGAFSAGIRGILEVEVERGSPGNRGGVIFRDTRDGEEFIKRLSENLTSGKAWLYALNGSRIRDISKAKLTFWPGPFCFRF
jgi:hypothetical protein